MGDAKKRARRTGPPGFASGGQRHTRKGIPTRGTRGKDIDESKGRYAVICEEICGGRAASCKCMPCQCPRAVNGSVDID